MEIFLHLFIIVGILGPIYGDEIINSPFMVTDQPYFDPTMKSNQTAHVGYQCELHCIVHSVGNNTVSWIRGSDLHILTSGRYTYTTDLRHEARHEEGTNRWTLIIRSAKPHDEGVYECQINTKPVTIFAMYLKVLQPRSEILGSPDLYVQRHSMINLTCILHDLPEPPSHVLWYHTNRFNKVTNITYSSSRGGISMIVEKGPTTKSYLLIQSARVTDSGVYTCAPSNHNHTNITLHVLNGEFPAAMQTNGCGGFSSSTAGFGATSIFVITSIFSRLLCYFNHHVT